CTPAPKLRSNARHAIIRRRISKCSAKTGSRFPGGVEQGLPENRKPLLFSGICWSGFVLATAGFGSIISFELRPNETVHHSFGRESELRQNDAV
ncbi:MAG TPA: hypothetical protein PLD51_00960, partial [Pontiellaceae bacterium]|nr:hypothetical protein [Pontiellaceae bacterium]